MKTKKILSVLISAAMLLSGITAVSAADETDVATVNGGGYSSLQAAFDAVTDGGTIVMQADTELTATAKLTGKKATLELNGKTIEFPGTTDNKYRAIYVGNGADLTIDGEGTISAGQVAVECSGAKATIKGGTYNGQFAIFAGNNTTVTVENGNFNGYVYTNGSFENSNLVINNGTFTKSFYLAAGKGSTYEINGGTFTENEESTIEIKGGKLTINGGTFTNTATEQKLEYNGNGSSSKGYALAVLAHKNYQGANVTVNGGTFNGPVGLNDVPVGTDVNSTLTIYGGTFKNDVSKYKPTVAKIGDKEYKSLENLDETGAFYAACTGEDKKIVLQADVTVKKRIEVLANSGDVILDLNGHTITSSIDPVIRVWQSGSLTVNDSVGTGMIKNTKSGADGIDCGTAASDTVNNLAKLTINNAIIDASYAVFAMNDADVTLNGGTYNGWVYTNGSYKNSNLKINNGTFTKSFYLAAGKGSTYEINGGTFTEDDQSTIEIKGGTLTINGGTFTNTATEKSLEYNGDGSSSGGYALAVLAHKNYQGANVTVNGGTFNGPVGLNDVPADTDVNSSLTIKGGSYVNEIKDYVPAELKQITIGKKYGVAEEKATDVTVADEETTGKVKEELDDKVLDDTTEKVDTFSLEELAQAYLVRATYTVTDENSKTADVDVDFDLGTASEIGGSTTFGVVFYNIPSGITISTPTISVAK